MRLLVALSLWNGTALGLLLLLYKTAAGTAPTSHAVSTAGALNAVALTHFTSLYRLEYPTGTAVTQTQPQTALPGKTHVRYILF